MSLRNERRALRSRTSLSGFTIGLGVITASLTPPLVSAQVEVSAGLLVVPQSGGDETQFGPVVSAAVSRGVLGLPLFLEMSIGRVDFKSLGQDYHENHYLFGLGAEWFPTRSSTRLGLRLGLGAYGEYQIVETDPASPGGDSWVEALVPGLILEHDLGGKQLVLGVTDFVLGPWFAVLDPSEYDIDHRIRVTVGLRF